MFFFKKTLVITNVCWHKRVLAQTCWAQSYVGTNVRGHNRVWAKTCVGTIVWAQVCMGTNAWSPLNIQGMLHVQGSGKKHVMSDECS